MANIFTKVTSSANYSKLAGGTSALNALTSLVGKKSGAMLKGLVMNMDTKVPYMFQYNPTELEYGRNAEYAEVASPGSSYPVVQYIKGNSREFNVELFFYDHLYQGTIDLARTYFSDFLPPENNKDRQFIPPIMLFYYGTFIKKCVLTSMTLRIERHNKYGLPVQARMTLSLKQVGE